MTEPIDQATKDLIEKESVAYRIGEFIDYGDQNENVENQIELAYVAGATVWAEKLKQERNKAIDECIEEVKYKSYILFNQDEIVRRIESLKDKSHE